jgi:hypothetical protein
LIVPRSAAFALPAAFGLALVDKTGQAAAHMPVQAKCPDLSPMSR